MAETKDTQGTELDDAAFLDALASHFGRDRGPNYRVSLGSDEVNRLLRLARAGLPAVTQGAELESAMSFCLRNSSEIDEIGSFAPLAKLIEARDNAVRRALLAELDTEAERNGAQDTGDNYAESVARLRAKYAVKP